MSHEVAMINVALGVAVMKTAKNCQSNAFDEDGDDCDPEDAVACVAGPDRDGMWVSIDPKQFEGGNLQMTDELIKEMVRRFLRGSSG